MPPSFHRWNRNRRARRERTALGSGGVGSAPSLIQRAAAADEGDKRAATADRLAPVDRRPASRLGALHRNDRPGRRGPKSVAAWSQLRIEAPVGHALHCRAAARAAAVGGKRDRSGGRSSPRRRRHRIASPEAEHCSSTPHRGSVRDNLCLNQVDHERSRGPELHPVNRRETAGGWSFLRYSQTSFGAVRSPPLLPVLSVPRGSTRSSLVSTIANGLCSTPLGTTNISPAFKSTAPSLKSMRK